MNLLSSDGENTPPSGGYTLREVVDNMRKLGGLVEIIGVAMKRCDDSEINRDTAEEFAWEAGSLVERLGARALELLDAQAAPEDPRPARKPRERTTKPRAIRLCTQLAGVEKSTP